MLMVIGAHYNLIGMGNGFLYTKQAGVNISLAAILESVCIVCVDTFIIITGYFSIYKKDFNSAKIFKFLTMIIFFNILQYILDVIIFKNTFSLTDLICQTFSGKWFIIIYLVLCIFSPYINKMVAHLKLTQYKKLVLLVFLIFIMYQTTLNYLNIIFPSLGWSGIIDKGIDSGYTIVNFVSLYLIGGYIRKSDIKLKLSYSIIGYVLSTIVIFALWYILYHNNLEQHANMAFYYNNIFVVTSSIFMFLIFNGLKIKNNKIINKIATSVLGVFILSTSPCFLRLFGYMNIAKYSVSKYLIPHFIITCIFVFSVCSVVSLLGNFLLEKTIFKFYDKKRRKQNEIIS